MPAQSPYKPQDEAKLMRAILDPKIADDPYAFVMFVFPWGKPNTPLANDHGPREWQKEELLLIKEHIRANKERMAKGESPLVYYSATASGRGVGKSTLVAWLNLWMMSCVLGGTCITSANSEDQLRTKTWAELGIWHTLMINSHWFDASSIELRPTKWFAEQLEEHLKIDSKIYYAKGQLWSEEKPDSYAGAHNKKGLMLIFDEASGIPEGIWKVAEGFFTELNAYRFWFAFSNPRRNTGAFFKCFHEHREIWNRRNLDSRSVKGTDLNHLNNIIKKFGEDSDESRIEVKGQFPRQGDKQFISRELAELATTRELELDPYAPLMMGVDPARFGDDSTVIRFRQGRDARSIPPIKLKGKDNMEVANECAALINKYNPDAVCIDAGNGTGIIDRLRELKYKVHEIWFGAKSDDEQWANKRTELWDRMREWLRGSCIDKDIDLVDDLVGPEYGYHGNSDKVILEPKEKMKSRGLASPDDADALACTFAVKVASQALKVARGNRPHKTQMARDVDYSIFGD